MSVTFVKGNMPTSNAEDADTSLLVLNQHSQILDRWGYPIAQIIKNRENESRLIIQEHANFGVADLALILKWMKQ